MTSAAGEGFVPKREPATVWQRARADPDELAIADGSRQLTWSAAADEVARAVDVLMRLGLGHGRRLAVFAENSVDTVIVYAAARVAGVGADVLSFHLGVDELVYILRQSGAAVIWADAKTAQVAVQASAALGGINVICRDEIVGPGRSWRQLLADAAAAPPSLAAPPDYELLFTSGTTGHPKAVRVPDDLPPTVEDLLLPMSAHHLAGLGRHLVVGPLYHSGPHAAVGLLLSGTPVVVLGRFDAARTLRAIQEYHIATTLMVPTHFVRLLALPAEVRASYDLSSLVLVAHTGSRCPVEVKRAMIDWVGPILRESYGSTESGIVAWISSREWLKHPGSVGRAAPGCDALVLDDEGNPVGPGAEGLLCFRTSSGRRIRYHNDDSAAREAYVKADVFTLGEIGYIDEEGYIFITDRSKDMVVSGGVNIYPAECERVLLDHPAVVDAGVFGVPDGEMGERLVGLVVMSDESSADGPELIEHCRSRLARFKVPRTLEIVPELPRTLMGKLNKRELRDWYLAAKDHRAIASPTDPDAQQKAKDQGMQPRTRISES
jgi:long-chain acyl-CoA synthetase